MILTFDDKISVLFIVLDPAKPDQHRKQPFASTIARMEAWGRKSPIPFTVRIAEPSTR